MDCTGTKELQIPFLHLSPHEPANTILPPAILLETNMENDFSNPEDEIAKNLISK